jgi:hypothetical protein
MDKKDLLAGKAGEKLAGKDYWKTKKHILNAEEHEEFMKKSGMSQEEHDAWHAQRGGKHD